MPADKPNSASKNILKLSSANARKFFLSADSYCNLDLPPYFNFSNILNNISRFLKTKKLSDLANKPRDYEGINYTILSNKDGKYAWRPFQLIHPALYVSLINTITEIDNWKFIRARFKKLSENKKIKCLSIPVVSLSQETNKAEQVSRWWQDVEQHSIELSLDYEYILETDITDCYGAIYTHSIVWALHTKAEAKAKRNDKNMLGTVIDRHIQDMRLGQTNGIPQGSVLMDFIAEIVLGYADSELSEKINSERIDDYCILRYRDDYRVFVNNPQEGEKIIKMLTEIMIDLGLKLNPSKTKASNNVIRSSIKSDKLSWIGREKWATSFQKRLLIIHEHSLQYPNSGSLAVAMLQYYKRLYKIKNKINYIAVLISITVDIAYRNPRTYPVSTAILSKLLSMMDNDGKKLDVIQKIQNKFSQIPNTGYMQIWLQRATIPFTKKINYTEQLCKLANGEDVSLWNNCWITSKDLIKIVNAQKIIDDDILKDIEPIIPEDEIELFSNYM